MRRSYAVPITPVSLAMASKELVAASTKPLVLSILMRGESYGYAIIQEVSRLSGGELQWTDGMLYPVLHRLERDGLIKARWSTAENGRRRKYYCLNKQGNKALEVERAQWICVNKALNRIWNQKPCPT
jgi:PadR family transcriptional regulator PadR